jgi:hypothetical protein
VRGSAIDDTTVNALTDGYTFATVPGSLNAVYSNPTATLSIYQALTTAECGDQLTLKLYMASFLNPLVKYESAEFYYTPSCAEIAANKIYVTYAHTVTDTATVDTIASATFNARVFIKRNADIPVIFNLKETPGNTIEVSGTNFLVNVNYINLADQASVTLKLKVISATDAAVTHSYTSSAQTVTNTNITGAITIA